MVVATTMYESTSLGKRCRSERESEDVDLHKERYEDGKKMKGWTFGVSDGSMLTGLTKVVSVVSDALTSLWRRPVPDRGHRDEDKVLCSVGNTCTSADEEKECCQQVQAVEEVDCISNSMEHEVDMRESSEDTETKYQKILSASTLARPGPPTVELSVAKSVRPVSRMKLRQQLLDKISVCRHSEKEALRLKGDSDVIKISQSVKSSSRGARMLHLVPKDGLATGRVQNTTSKGVDGDTAVVLPRIVSASSIDDTEKECFSEYGCDPTQEEVSLVDMPCYGDVHTAPAERQQESPPSVLFSESSPDSYDQCGIQGDKISHAMEIVENLVADLGMGDLAGEASAGTPRMLLFEDVCTDDGPSLSLRDTSSPEGNNLYNDATEDVFSGFHVVTPFDTTCSKSTVHLSPLPFLLPSTDEGDCMVIEHHKADLSPEDGHNHLEKGFCDVTQGIYPSKPGHIIGDAACQNHQVETEEPISSVAARQGSLKSAKALLKKRVTLKQAQEDALFTRLREVIVNRHLAESHKQGHAWARLDARGIEQNPSIDHSLVENEVLDFVRQEKGDGILKEYLDRIENEWRHISSVRQKYSACDGKEHGCTPNKSILKRSLPSDRNHHQNHRIRWALENIQHRYPAMEMKEDDHQALPPKSSTRGLRMLLASASPNVVKQSPKPCSIDHETDKSAKKPTTYSRSRSRTMGAPGRASQGQRLFQALQQGSCCAEQQIHAPRTLSMIFDQIEDGNECYSNTTSTSMTTSDNTTSSNSSSCRGGIPVGGRWSAEEVACLIQGFKECILEDGSRKSVWKSILDKYKGKGISECRTSVDVRDKWKNLRRTAIKKVNARYVKLDEATLEWLRSEDAKPHGRAVPA